MPNEKTTASRSPFVFPNEFGSAGKIRIYNPPINKSNLALPLPITK
jgi:hypothetical protein